MFYVLRRYHIFLSSVKRLARLYQEVPIITALVRELRRFEGGREPADKWAGETRGVSRQPARTQHHEVHAAFTCGIVCFRHNFCEHVLFSFRGNIIQYKSVLYIFLHYCKIIEFCKCNTELNILRKNVHCLLIYLFFRNFY